ncbi:hypothetical protein BC939DRAFT_451497 [Gamsiella multidivaricata]|uniref:uncharacterized protein n=1 Tax=Gamsiella multidivaricata TaxID=101098 RepID=UPI00221F903C|nr:uncharacterized protein BC939DRAFT_451497 [Gamsiella multidivaricata]KAI7823608.1 hypothetical protein BC939DRAFT_451497 [Gamsiella multidivaricata]
MQHSMQCFHSIAHIVHVKSHAELFQRSFILLKIMSPGHAFSLLLLGRLFQRRKVLIAFTLALALNIIIAVILSISKGRKKVFEP